jgi:eukaryotic-like serine/threonine-protein kinase
VDGTDSLVGKRIGNYVVASLLGRGGMGEVYVAEHPKIGRKVAIKVLAGDLMVTDFLAQRFLAEAKAVARIGHPNVVDIYDFGNLDDGRLYYVMELLQGRELRAVLTERGTLTPAEALPYVEQICAGLQAAHDRGVVHRDLKPENIFVLDRQPLALKVLDFGIAKLLEGDKGSGMTSSGMVMGTPLYIAPEQALGQPERISPRTDVYSLGVLMYVMLCGRPPFESEANAVLMAMHIRDAPPPLRERAPSVPVEVANVVERCLAKEPGQRPVSAAELAYAFGQAVSASRTGPPTLTLEPAPPAVAVPLTLSSQPPASDTTFSAAAGEQRVAPSEELQALLRRRPAMIRNVVIAAVALAVVGTVTLVLVRGGRGPTDPGKTAVRAPAAPDRTQLRPDAAPAAVAARPDRTLSVDAAAAPRPVAQPRPRPRPVAKPEPKPAPKPAIKPAVKPAKDEAKPVPKPKPQRKVGEGTMEMDD